MKKMSLFFVLFVGLMAGISRAQDLCSTLQNCNFLKSENFYLIDFTDEVQFGPAPDCGGHVTVLYPDGKTQCILPYEVWGKTIIIGKNSYNMNFKLVDDILVSQNNSKWETLLTQNGCSATELEPDACSPDHLDLCPNQTACEVVGGNWCDNSCLASSCPTECPPCPECPDSNTTCPEPDCNCTCHGCSPNIDGEVCPLEGKVFSTSINGTEYQLSNFECGFGPGCGGACDLWYGNFKFGPIYHYSAGLPFLCRNGSIEIAGCPCAFDGDTLKCLIVPDNFKCIKIGTRTWCVEKGTPMLDFTSK